MKLTLESVLRKVAHPPAPQNWVRLIVPDDEIATAVRIARFALGIPEFNYVVGSKMCHGRVMHKLDLGTALKACARYGAPAGRDQNAAFVRAFFAYDDRRGYSEAQYLDSYNGFFPISRDVRIPTKPTFTILENKKQIPVVLCGWKSVPLDFAQRRIISTVYESGLFSYGAYRHSPADIVFFPEMEMADGPVRSPEIWKRGEFGLMPSAELRDLLEFFALAQERAIPIIKERWAIKEEKLREKDKAEIDSGLTDIPAIARHPDLFEPR